MKITGRFFEITNLTGFFKNPQNPDPKTFKPIDGGVVVLNTDFPGGFNAPFHPQYFRPLKGGS